MKLKPCPFCGGTAILVKKTSYIKCFTNKGGSTREPIPTFYINCNQADCDVDVETLERFSKEEVIEAWNKRHEPENNDNP